MRKEKHGRKYVQTSFPENRSVLRMKWAIKDYNWFFTVKTFDLTERRINQLQIFPVVDREKKQFKMQFQRSTTGSRTVLVLSVALCKTLLYWGISSVEIGFPIKFVAIRPGKGKQGGQGLQIFQCLKLHDKKANTSQKNRGTLFTYGINGVVLYGSISRCVWYCY